MDINQAIQTIDHADAIEWIDLAAISLPAMLRLPALLRIAMQVGAAMRAGGRRKFLRNQPF